MTIRKEYIEALKVFGFGLLQVTLVAMNTSQIAERHYFGAVIIGFSISLVWTFNVRSAMQGWRMSLVYATGAACGTLLGMLLATTVYGH